jgi:cytochrome b561
VVAAAGRGDAPDWRIAAALPLDPPRPATAGYRPLTKVLHWSTVAALVAQFTIGYAMDAGGSGRGRGRGRGGGPGRGRGRGGDLDVFGDDGLLTAHVVLGVTILVLATVRLWWRRRSTLPPWAPGLSAAERTLAHWNERALYTLLFAVPLTGLWLVLISDDAVAVHIASHVALFVVVAAHVGLVLKHQLLDRDRLLRRMI